MAHSDARLSLKIKACSGVNGEDFLIAAASPDVVEPAAAAGKEVADRSHAGGVGDGVFDVVWDVEGRRRTPPSLYLRSRNESPPLSWRRASDFFGVGQRVAVRSRGEVAPRERRQGAGATRRG